MRELKEKANDTRLEVEKLRAEMAKLLREKEEMDTKIEAYRKQELTSDRVR